MIENSEQRLRTVCPHDCPDACSILATVQDGRVVRCEGDDAHPFTRGFLCHKVGMYEKRIYSPDRVLYPMLRRRKGGELERVSWDEALDVVARRLGHGEQILPYSYGGNMGLIARSAGDPFFHALGACTLERTICDDAADAAWRSMVGRTVGTDIERMPQCDLIVCWGMNMAVVNIHAMPFVRDAQKNGARFIVVDPYRNETARMADRHVIPRPGTDAALALGLARVLLDENLLDAEFISKRTEGFHRLHARLREYPVERCAQICGVQNIPEIARELASARAPFFRLGIGFSRHANGGQAVRSVLALAAMLGAFRNGGALFETAAAFLFDHRVLSCPQLQKAPTRRVNMNQLGQALTADNRIKSLFVYQCNPAAVAPDQFAVRRGLSRDDLFVVVHEQMMTDTVSFADVVLPACTSFENSDLYQSYGHYYLQRSRPVVPPLGESVSNVTLFNRLAARFGFNDPIFQADGEERIQMLLATRQYETANIDMAALDRGEAVRLRFTRDDPFEFRFPTRSGRFMFANDALPDPLPSYVPCEEGWDSPLRARYPLQLLAPPAKHFLNTTFGSVAALVAKQKRAAALLHPSDALARGLTDGDLARLYNDRGETFAYTVVTDDVPAGVVVVPSVWWGSKTPGGVNVNALTSQAVTDLGACSTFHCALVECARA